MEMSLRKFNVIPDIINEVILETPQNQFRNKTTQLTGKLKYFEIRMKKLSYLQTCYNQDFEAQKLYKQKMEIKKNEFSVLTKEILPICNELNLDMVKLNEDTLMANPTYRRLYNIVLNDMSRSDLSFRKNLIKELYFLLQITPIIRTELKEHFLVEVQKWYNLNDHKKIDLASNKLNNLLNMVHSKKQSTYQPGVPQKPERPKTGVTWNQNVSPFLRPYTAKRSSTVKTNKRTIRPESSKVGTQSTKVQTQDYCIRQFTTNIQQQLQISQDFIQKHRTNHPEYEPIYEQLYNILKKIETQPSQIPVVTGKSLAKAARYAKSALPRKQESMVREPSVRSEHQIDNQQLSDAEKPAVDAEQKDSQQSSSEQEQYLYVNEKKPYKAFSGGVKFFDKQNNKKTEPQGLQKYTHLANNKLTQALRQDKQMAQKYVNFARAKSAMRRQLNRKSQSRRLMSAKHSGPTKNIKFVKQQLIVNEDSKENIEQNSFKCFDLTLDPLAVNKDVINPYPTYNKRQALKYLYEQPIKDFKKRNVIEEVSLNIRQNVKRPLTSFVRFQSPIKFDPMSNDNIKKYNQEVLEEIQKIKMKIGGKCYASTESLMKALTIDHMQAEDLPKWETKNPYFGMNSMGKGKKLKKKGKLNKSKKTLIKN